MSSWKLFGRDSVPKKKSVLRFFHLTLPYSILLYIFCVSLGPRVFSPGPQTVARLGGSSTDFPRKDLSALAPTSFMALIAVIYMAVMQLGSRGLDAVWGRIIIPGGVWFLRDNTHQVALFQNFRCVFWYFENSGHSHRERILFHKSEGLYHWLFNDICVFTESLHDLHDLVTVSLCISHHFSARFLLTLQNQDGNSIYGWLLPPRPGESQS